MSSLCFIHCLESLRCNSLLLPICLTHDFLHCTHAWICLIIVLVLSHVGLCVFIFNHVFKNVYQVR